MALPLGNRQAFRGRGGPFRGRNPWRQMGGPWGVSVEPWLLDATALAVRTAIREPSSWGTTGSATGWLMPGTARLRLSGDSRASVTMARQSDGTFAWEPMNLLAQSASATGWFTNASPTDGGAGSVIDGAQTHRWSATGAFSGYYLGIAAVAAGQPFAINAYIARVSGSENVILGTDSGGRATAQINPATGAIVNGPAGTTVTAVSGGWRVFIPYTGDGDTVMVVRYIVNAGTTMDSAMWVHFGHVPLAYVPTTAAARYAPGVEHEGGAWRVQAYAQATNRALWSRDLTNAAWVKTSCTAGLTATGIDGAANAASVLTATGANATCLQTVTHTSTERALSIFLRRRTGTGTVETTINGGTTWVARVLTSSWQRFETVATLANPQFGVRIVTNGDAVDVDVVQCEDGAFAGPPIPTQASTVTRTADAALALLPATIAAGTVVVDYIASGAGSQIVVDVSDGTANERHRITHDGVYTVTDGGVTQASPDGGTPNAATRNRVAIGWAANDFAVSLNGAAPVTDASGTVPTVDRILIGEIGAGVQRLRALDRKLPNGRIQSLAA